MMLESRSATGTKVAVEVTNLLPKSKVSLRDLYSSDVLDVTIH